MFHAEALFLADMTGDYDKVAPFYDSLSRLIYGDAILQSQIFLIKAIPPGSSVLIIGGGTGYILEEISKKHRSGLQITYIDISKKMIAYSKERNRGDNKVAFINESMLDVTLQQQFDVVITPFFLDNFSDNTAEIVFDKIDALLVNDGLWLLAEFQSKKNKLWQKFTLKFMYFFFRLVCNIEATHLPATQLLFDKYNYQVISMKTFFKDFIYSVVYKKR